MSTKSTYRMDRQRYMDLTNMITSLMLSVKAAMTLTTSTEQALGWFIFACMYMGMQSPDTVSKGRLVTNTLGVVASLILVIGNVA